MKKHLLLRALLKLLSGLVTLSVLLFLSAGTLRYPRAWLFIALLFIPMCILGATLFVKDPALLEKRLNAKESERDQRVTILLSALMFSAGFVLAGLDFRFHWTQTPVWLTVAAAVVFLCGYAMFVAVLKQNAFLSRTVEVQEDQHVVDTGLYGVVRHPMYTATLLLYLTMPLILGSLVSFAVFLLYPFLIVRRIRSEEAVLTRGLDGYAAYKTRVKYRLIPFIW